MADSTTSEEIYNCRLQWGYTKYTKWGYRK